MSCIIMMNGGTPLICIKTHIKENDMWHFVILRQYDIKLLMSQIAEYIDIGWECFGHTMIDSFGKEYLQVVVKNI